MSAANDSARARITSSGTFSDQAAATAARRVFHLEGDLAAARQRHAVQRQHDLFAIALGDDHLVVADEDRLAARAAMPDDDRVVAVDGEVEDAAGAMRLHADHQRIVGVEHRDAVGRHDVDDAALHLGQFLRRVDFAQAEVIAVADVGDHGHVAAVEGQALAEDSAAGGFQHGRVDGRVHQHGAGALRPAAIAAVDPAAVDENAVGAGHAHAQARALEDVGDESRGGRLAVHAGDGDDRGCVRRRRRERGCRRWLRPRGGKCPPKVAGASAAPAPR